MKRTVVALGLALACAVPSGAQTKKETDDAMQMYIELAKPVAEHRRLEQLTGRWSVVTKLWFSPDGKPIVWQGTGTGRMILGGRFLQLDMKYADEVAGESLNLFGFDRRTSDYTLVGFDTLGTYSISAAGKYDEALKAIVLNGSYLQPPQNTMQAYTFHLARSGADAHVFTLFFDMNGKQVKVAETTLTRGGK